MDIRVLRPSDIPHVQLANITNLPENYFCKYYLYHAMSWPQLSYVAVDVSLFTSCSVIEERAGNTIWKDRIL
jgi:ribosomal protein S18 acetylase RimI-like enzyme